MGGVDSNNLAEICSE